MHNTWTSLQQIKAHREQRVRQQLARLAQEREKTRQAQHTLQQERVEQRELWQMRCGAAGTLPPLALYRLRQELAGYAMADQTAATTLQQQHDTLAQLATQQQQLQITLRRCVAGQEKLANLLILMKEQQ